MNKQFFANPVGSKIGQRMLRLFLLCVMLPIIIIAVISDIYVHRDIKSRAVDEMTQLAHACCNNVYDILNNHAAALRHLSTRCSPSMETDGELMAPGGPMRDKFTSAVIKRGENEYVVGDAVEFPALTDAEAGFLAETNVLVRVAPDGRVLMICERDGAFCMGVVQSSIFEMQIADLSAYWNAKVVILTDDEFVVAGDASDMPRLREVPGDRGERQHIRVFEHTPTGEKYLGVTRPIFLRGSYGASDWHVMLIRKEADILAPFQTFRRTLSCLLSMAGIGMFLLVVAYVRRSTRHIETLRDATLHIAQHDFDHRISIRSGDEFQQLGGAFNIMASDLQQKEQELLRAQRMETLGKLAAGVAHDLNTVLCPMIALPDIILQDLERQKEAGEELSVEAFKDDISVIRDSANRGAAIVQSLLTLGRRGRFQPEPVSVGNVVSDQLNMAWYSDLSRAHSRVEVTVDIDSELPAVSGVPTQLGQVFMNLIKNAFEAMPGGGKLSISVASETVREGETGREQIVPGDYVVARVRDTGVGIAPEDLAHVFEAFYTRKTTTEASGSGLGLAVVRTIVDDHHGFVDVTTDPNVGTEFAVYLPALGPAVEHRKEKREPSSLGGTESILIVDAHARQRRVLDRLLKGMGYSIRETESSGAALSLLQEDLRRKERAEEDTTRSSFDIVLVDIALLKAPERNVCARITEMFPAQKIIVVGYGGETGDSLSIPDGITIVTRPLTLARVATAIRDALNA